MDILMSKYEDLIAKETDIKKDLRRARDQQKKPTESVLLWLKQVGTIKDQFRGLDRFLEENSTKCLTNYYLHQKHSKLISKITKTVNQLQENSNFPEGLVVAEELYVEQFPARPQLLVRPKLVGDSIHKTSDEIFEHLMDPDFRIIGVYGTGGVGKTTAMMNINNRLLTTQVFDKVIWVTLSKNWSLEKVQDDIAMQLNAFLPTYENEESRATRLLECLEKVDKFLIILDDMWEPISLKKVGIPLPEGDISGRKIVVVSRSWELCQRMEANKYIKIDVLSEKEAWDLFLSKAGVITPPIQPLARQLVYKCDYLPILVISLGHAMRDEIDLKEWMKALKKLSVSLSAIQGTEEKNLTLLKFSYDRLKGYRVRHCFLYCAFFPEDYLFEPEELIRYWIAEDYVSEESYGRWGKEDGMAIQLHEGAEILKKLQDANMLEIFTRKGHEWLKVHDLFRDLAIHIMKYETRSFPNAGRKKPPSTEEWHYSDKISLVRNHIEVLDNILVTNPHLSTLLLRDNPLLHISPSFFSSVCSIEVLDMSYSGIIELPSSLSMLANLRALFLHHCTSLENISSVEHLQELRILNLHRTSIKEFPQGRRGLRRLRSLDLSETTRLRNISVGVMASLVFLEELHLKGKLLIYDEFINSGKLSQGNR